MKATKRVIAVALVLVVTMGLVAVLAACDNTFSMNWSNYALEMSELVDAGLNNKMPTSVSSISSLSNASEINSTYASSGLITAKDSDSSYVYGYLIASDATFAKNDGLNTLRVDKAGVSFIGETSSGTKYLYDVHGDLVVKNSALKTSIVSAYVDGKNRDYLAVTTNYSTTEDGDVAYYEINAKTGKLSRPVDKLPSANDLPQVGDSFTKATQTLEDWLDVESFMPLTEDPVDDTLTAFTVQTFGRTTVFYKNGKQTASYVEPLNFNALAYADGKLLYSTLTPVDVQASAGYNYVDGTYKYNSKMFSLDIKTGKVKELSVDYVMISSGGSLYNKKKGKFDLAMIQAYRMVDGVAYKNEASQDMLIINSKGAVGFSYSDSAFGIPTCKLGKNFLAMAADTSSYNPIFNIVDGNGKLVVSLGSVNLQAILSDSIVVTVNGKVGTVGFDGVVKTEFKYKLQNEVFGNFTYLVDDDNKQIVLDLSKGIATTIETMCGLTGYNNIEVFDYFIRVGSNSYSWYLLDGTRVAENTTTEMLSPTTVTANGRTYGLVVIRTANGPRQYLRLVF